MRLTALANLLFLLLVTLLGISIASAVETNSETPPIPEWQLASGSPDRIVATVATDPATGFSVTWRTNQRVDMATAEITRATADARFDIHADAVSAKTTVAALSEGRDGLGHYRYPANAGLAGVNYHSVTFKNLTPNTLYAYRVSGKKGRWSEWFQIKTAPKDKRADIDFLYFGDAQNGIYSQWPRVLRAAWNKAPNASFALYAGDLVNEGSKDKEWGEWIKAGGFMHAMVPAIVVPGNHEYDWRHYQGQSKKWALSALWKNHFTLPETQALPAQLQETAYKVSYPDLDIYVLDSEALGSNELLDAQAKWLDDTLQASTATWRIVTMHHPIFSSCGIPLERGGQDEPNIRAAFLPILLKHNVDLVLQGHDHTYSRGSIGMTGFESTVADAGSSKKVKSVFITSVGGPKNYPQKTSRWQQYQHYGVTLDRIAENTPTYQVIKKRADSLSYQSYTADGVLYDAFTLSKGDRDNRDRDRDRGDREETTIEVSTGLPRQRVFSNTGAYKSHHDLSKALALASPFLPHTNDYYWSILGMISVGRFVAYLQTTTGHQCNLFGTDQ